MMKLRHVTLCIDINSTNSRHRFFVFDIAVAAGEMPLVLVDTAIKLGSLEGASASRVTEYRVLVLHRKTHFELLLMSLQTAHFLNVLHVLESSHVRRSNKVNSGQLSLLPSVGREMITGQSAVIRCGWVIKARWLIPFVDERAGGR